MQSPFLILAVLVYAIIAYILRKNSLSRSLHYQKGCHPPVKLSSWNILSGPGTFIENFLLTARGQWIDKSNERFLTIGRTYQTKSFGTTVIHTMHQENLQAMFATKAADWGAAGQRLPVRELVGVGIITSDGDFHHEARELFKPLFESREWGDFERYEVAIRQLFDILPGDGETVDIQPLLMHMHLDFACSFLFGDDLGALAGNSSFSAQSFRTSFEAALRGAGLRIALGPMSRILPRAKWLESCKSVHSFVEKYVDQAMSLQTTDTATDEKLKSKSRTFLQRIAESTKDRTQVRDHVLNALMAALENEAVLQSNCLFVLARHPEEWKRLKAETESLGDQKLTIPVLRSLPLIRNFINEVLRLYPILFKAPRIALVPTTLPTGGGPSHDLPIHIPPGTHVTPYLVSTHTDPEIWGADVNEFNPDRWNSFKPSAWQFLPFGGGARACLGKQKTLLQTTYFLVRVLRAFERVESRGGERVPEMKITTRSREGCRVALYRKEEGEAVHKN